MRVKKLLFSKKGAMATPSPAVAVVHEYGTEKNSNITHNFVVDDLKLYAKNINTTKKLLDLIAIFSKDTGMTFGEGKCAY